MNIQTSVSMNVKRIREKRKLTLDAAADATGISRSMLALIEKGEANPTLSVLWKIANGYKVSFSALTDPTHTPATVVRADEIVPLYNDDGKYINEPAFPFDERRLFETYRIRILPGGALQAEPHLAGAEEFITVFAGRVEIDVAEQIFALGVGDSIRFLADVAHAYRNVGADEAAMSMIIYYNR